MLDFAKVEVMLFILVRSLTMLRVTMTEHTVTLVGKTKMAVHLAGVRYIENDISFHRL